MGRISKNAVRVLATYEMLLSAAEPLSTKTIINNLERDYDIKVDKKTVYSDIAAINNFFRLYVYGRMDIFPLTWKQRGGKMKHERYIINDEEIKLLDRYEGTMNQYEDPHRYDTFSAETLTAFCRMKDRSNDMYSRRYQAARDVIDLVAKQVNINPDNTSFWIYAPDCDGSSPIIHKIEEYFQQERRKS